jgi:NlpC/P60 family putative phage cell wall peptidase
MNPFATEATRWLGTPFHPHAALKGVGCDCYGLITGVYSAVTGREVVLPTDYPPQWRVIADYAPRYREHLLSFAEQVVTPSVGDVLVFAINSREAHLGILVNEHSFIHARGERGVGTVCLNPFNEKWRARHHATYRLKE